MEHSPAGSLPAFGGVAVGRSRSCPQAQLEPSTRGRQAPDRPSHEGALHYEGDEEASDAASCDGRDARFWDVKTGRLLHHTPLPNGTLSHSLFANSSILVSWARALSAAIARF